MTLRFRSKSENTLFFHLISIVSGEKVGDDYPHEGGLRPLQFLRNILASKLETTTRMKADWDLCS